jgi:hypothetical protein
MTTDLKTKQIMNAFCKRLGPGPFHYNNIDVAAVLREVVEQYRVGGLLYCEDILELANELEAL